MAEMLKIRISVRHIGWITGDEIKDPAGNRCGPVTAQEFDIGQRMLICVLPGNGECGLADISGCNVAIGAFFRNRQRNCTAAGTQVKHGEFLAARYTLQDLVDQHLGFRTRHQRIRADDQGHRPEFFFAGHVGERQATGSPVDT